MKLIFLFSITIFLIAQANGSAVAEIKMLKVSNSHSEKAPYCPNVDKSINCHGTHYYRTYDGSCNNLNINWWGKTRTPYKRLLRPEYDNDYDAIRTKSSMTNHNLPEPIELAYALPERAVNSKHSAVMIFLGQFVAHDLTEQENAEAECECNSGHPECMTINIKRPSNGPNRAGKQLWWNWWKTKDEKCLIMHRNDDVRNVFDCNFKRREQYSKSTHWIDLDLIYGRDEEGSRELREFRHGLLKTSRTPGSVKKCLPIRDRQQCIQKDRKTTGCYLTPDERDEEVGYLTCMHTMFLREHNDIAKHLYELNAHWTDEMLYQEARRLSIAIFQNMIYKDFLPWLIGDENMKRFDLYSKKSGYSYKYNDHLYPNAINEFVAGGFRLHNLISPDVMKADKNLCTLVKEGLNKFFQNQYETFNDLDSICRGLLVAKTQDSHFQASTSINYQYLEDFEMKGDRSSLPAMNSQRGREHGFQSYTSYRYWALGEQVTSWEDLYDFDAITISHLKQVYERPEDIDLWIGMIGENSRSDGMLGPTQSLIIAKQFHDIKYSDRFWFESGKDKDTRFTSYQLDQIRTYSTSAFFCKHMDANIWPEEICTSKRPNPFPKVPEMKCSRSGKKKHPISQKGCFTIYKSCDKFKKIDFSYWKEISC